MEEQNIRVGEKKNLIDILIADDEEGIRNLYKNIFKDKYNVTLVSNGREALNELGKKKYGLMITDGEMPEVDGIGVITTVKNDDKYAKNKDIKAILISGSSDYVKKAGNFENVKGMDKFSTIGNIKGFLQFIDDYIGNKA
jgi:CheY-like chemotaxis protein